MRTSLIATIFLVGTCELGAQSPTSYSGGVPFLKRRPFKPGPETDCAVPNSPQAAAVAGTIDRPITIMRGPIVSPYSMIRYEMARTTTESETLPAPAAESTKKEDKTVPVETAPAPRAEYLPMEPAGSKSIPR
jgi:hypothetical protein